MVIAALMGMNFLGATIEHVNAAGLRDRFRTLCSRTEAGGNGGPNMHFYLKTKFSKKRVFIAEIMLDCDNTFATFKDGHHAQVMRMAFYYIFENNDDVQDLIAIMQRRGNRGIDWHYIDLASEEVLVRHTDGNVMQGLTIEKESANQVN